MLAVLAASPAALAQSSHYVTDELRVNLRTGAGNDYRIRERIRSGTGLTILAERGGWTRVRTEGGLTGWMPSQYVTADAPAVTRLPTMETELTDARERILALESRLQRVRNERDSAHERLEQLENERDKLAAQIEQASRGLELAEENQRLKKTNVDLKRRIQELNNRVEGLAGQNRQQWFLVGAGVLGAGLIVGLLLGRVRGARRGRSNPL
jgi:SH3 domain protein